ncbi:BamA/TamA family outer membrane protein [Hymenobacter cavernae]|uniref:BamA/TamA family outer membrane protein n=1 Tax=Hymenobacter cavernae TaxID=2044852 RepID=UPI001668701B|nr:BamA/TamA family outer membrane protein [Hymenobacter cavernae]
MLYRCWLLLSGFLLVAGHAAFAQTDSLGSVGNPQSHLTRSQAIALIGERDIRDVFHTFFPRPVPAKDTLSVAANRKFVWIIPAPGYTQQTRGLLQLTGNVSYHEPGANMSTLIAALAYTQNKQLIFNAASSIWRANNRINWVGDWRLMHYPQNTYGLGMHTSLNRPIAMDYEYLRFYQSALFKIRSSFYAGLGYQLDYHWNIESGSKNQEVTTISDYTLGVNGHSISSGPALTLLYDSRGNAINPERGLYSNLVLRPNLELLGSDTSFQSLLLDVRKYLRLTDSGNVLALWSYNALTLHGNPPFLDLPSTGWDTYSSVGRGFIQGRFRGKDLLYGEAEYRFGLTRNRLLGGVLFTNAQTVSERITHNFEKVVPAAGFGLRLSMNKISRTNLAVDYGFGADGSRGLTFNLGEVF